MKQLLLVKYALPFILWYGFMIFCTIVIDYLLHHFQLIEIGRQLGLIGTLFIVLSFIYSLRKRKIIQAGSPKNFLTAHEYLAWIGSVMLLVHAGIHFNALIPWLAILMLLIVVASGLVGKFLLKKANESLKEKLQLLTASGMSKATADKELFFDAVTVDIMKQWRVVHLPITFLLGVLSLIHIITIIMYSK
jgi:hypothetical protein